MGANNPPVICYADGLCEPANPGGYACGGYVIEDHPQFFGRKGNAAFCHGEEATNNVAEYEAALLCLRAVWNGGWRGSVILRTDSQLVVKQYTGAWACNKEHLQARLRKLRKAGSMFESLTLEWIPREDNWFADEQSRMAYRRAACREGGASLDPNYRTWKDRVRA